MWMSKVYKTNPNHGYEHARIHEVEKVQSRERNQDRERDESVNVVVAKVAEGRMRRR